MSKVAPNSSASPFTLSETKGLVFDDPKHHLRLYQGDCLDLLSQIPESSVDLVFADPPYFLSNGGITCHAGKMVSVNKGAWDKLPGPDFGPVRARYEKVHEFNLSWLAACQRVLKPNGSIWVSGTAHVIHSVGFAMQQLGFKLLNDISWVKPNPPPNLSCRYFTHATETIIWAAKNSKSCHTFNYKLMKEKNGGKQMKSVWEISPRERHLRPIPRVAWDESPDWRRHQLRDRIPFKHPTQKPVALLERILLASSNEGDLVLDPFSGSGTTLLAAFRLRRHALGCELSAGFLTLSLRRLCSNLVQVEISISSLEISFASLDFSVDPLPDPMDRSFRSAGILPAPRCSGRSLDRSASASERSHAGAPSAKMSSRASVAPSATRRGICFSAGAPSSVCEGGDFSQMSPQLQLVQQERRFYFIGRSDRRVIFSVLADSLDEARQKFRASGRPDSDALFIIKTETEIYLA